MEDHGIKEREISNEGIPEETFSVELLPLIKDSQQSHGLRHGDYQRYRQYCARRLKRLRNSLHFKLGTRHGYKGKQIVEETVTDARFLHILLVEAERCWSHAMELKLRANTEPRKRFHMMRKLTKAAKYASELYKLSEMDRVEPRTKLEAQAYSFWMTANLKFELQDWKTAVELYTQTRSIYEKLAGAFLDEATKTLYLQRVEEIGPNIRYCTYNLGQSGMDINDLMNMKSSAVGQDMLSAKIDAAIKQTREKLASSFGELNWRGKTVPIRNERARVFILRAQDKECEIKRQDVFEGKMEVFDNLLMECKEALQAIKDDIGAETSSKKKNEVNLNQLHFIKMYLSHQRQTLMIERNLVMIDSMIEKLPMLIGQEKQGQRGKASKPEDLIRLYDGILLSLIEIKQLPGIDEEKCLLKELDSQITAYKGFRCFYIGQSYQVQKKWIEATALYDRVLEYADSATTAMKELNNPLLNVLVTKVENLAEQAKGHKYAAHASSILETCEVETEMTKLTVTDGVLLENLDVWQDYSTVPKNINLVRFPPEPKPLPCKPLFFDLALNHIDLPNLDHRMEKQTKEVAGFSGLVKGWLWGNK